MKIAILILLLLLGCQAGTQQPYKDVNYYTGTHGVTLQLIENSPPSVLDEESNFVIRANVHNQGAYTIGGDEKILLGVIKDDYFFQGNTEAYQALSPLHGKSDSYPTGQVQNVHLGLYKANTIPGNFEKPETHLVVTACYPYETQLLQDVCIDTDPAKLNQRIQPCRADKPSPYTGQGAPVAITKVEADMQQLPGGYIRPMFKIYVDNKDKGVVLSPRPNPHGKTPEETCTLHQAQKDEIDIVQINAYLSDLQLDCGDDPVDYVDIGSQEAWVRCYVTDEQLRNQPDRFGQRDNYKTTLRVELNYTYLNTIQKKTNLRHVKTLKKPSPEKPDESLSEGLTKLDLRTTPCEPWQHYDGIECVNRCDYCGHLNPNEPKPEFCTAKLLGQTYKITRGFGCDCDEDSFNELFQRETWYYDSTLKDFKPFKLAIPGNLCPDDSGCCKAVDCSNYNNDPAGCKVQPECAYCAKNTLNGKKSCLPATNEVGDNLCAEFCGERSHYNSATKECEKPPEEKLEETFMPSPPSDIPTPTQPSPGIPPSGPPPSPPSAGTLTSWTDPVGRTVTLRSDAMTAFQNAQTTANGNIEVQSSYRDYDDQVNACITLCGSQGATYGCTGNQPAITTSPNTCAKPGTSNHEKGIAIDVSNPSYAKSFLLAHHWCQPLPNSDAGHFSYATCG